MTGSNILVFQGRFHLYQGWHPTEFTLGVYVSNTLEARELVVSNAAGTLNPTYKPGDLMLIEDPIEEIYENAATAGQAVLPLLQKFFAGR